MTIVNGKLSNYVGQAKDKNGQKLDAYLVSLDRDIQNIWRFFNLSFPYIGTGLANLATNADNGFSYIPVMSANPTGTPTDYTGHSAMVFCTSNSSLYIFNTSNNNWKIVALT